MTDRSLVGGEERLLQIVEATARAGGDRVAIQLREKDLDHAAAEALARRVWERVAPHGAATIVNGFAFEGCGLQLPFGNRPLRHPAERGVGPYGRSTHSVEELGVALSERPDYVVFGPVWATREKPRPAGIEALRAACAAAATVPVIAIGGIGPEQAGEARAAGAHGVAVIRAVLAAPDAGAATAALLAALH